MTHSTILKGHLIGPRTVELDHPAPQSWGEVEVILCGEKGQIPDPREHVSEILKRLGPGIRTRDEIDDQINAERDSWGRAE